MLIGETVDVGVGYVEFCIPSVQLCKSRNVLKYKIY